MVMRCAAIFGIVVFLLAPPAAIRTVAAPATATVVTVHLQISGGVHYAGVLTASSRSRYNGCSISHTGFNPSSPTKFTVSYHADVFTVLGPLPSQAFLLWVPSYQAQTSRYTGSKPELDLVVGRHYFRGGGAYAADTPQFRMTVQINRTGHTGTFTASHVAARHGKNLLAMTDDGYTVRVVGRWTCSTVTQG